MRESFGWIFWGLLIVLFDFRINDFNFLPDGLGYLIVAYGASRLADQSAEFRAATSLSIFLAVVWLCRLFISTNVEWLITFLVTMANVAMFWSLLGGMIVVTISHNRADLADRAANRRIAYAVLTCVSMIFSLGSTSGIGGLSLLAVVALVAAIVVGVMILHLVYRISNELA